MTRKPDLRRGHHRRKYTTRVEVTLDPPLYERWTAALSSPLADGMSGAAVLRSLITEWIELAEHDTCDHAAIADALERVGVSVVDHTAELQRIGVDARKI